MIKPMCNCINEIKTMMTGQTYQGREIEEVTAPIGILFEKNQTISRVVIGFPVKLKGLKKEKEISVMAKFCPFCGEKQAEG